MRARLITSAVSENIDEKANLVKNISKFEYLTHVATSKRTLELCECY